MLISTKTATRVSPMSGCECKPDAQRKRDSAQPKARAQPSINWTTTFVEHWPEYVSEGLGLGLFMISACTFGTLLAHPASPVVRLVQNPTMLRTLMGAAMGATTAALVYSRFGKRSGAHLNPSTTLTFLWLRKVEPIDAFFYIAAQFVGAVLGVCAAGIVLGSWLAHPAVDYVVTLPGRYGYWWAFLAEGVITFFLMSVILRVSNTPKFNRYTGLFAASLVTIYISIEAPISGMSMNPARTLGSAFSAANWTAIWIYFTAPPIGMLMAAQFYVRSRGAGQPGRVLCAKLHHDNRERCIFRCDYPAQRKRDGAQPQD
jgi:aquaporin Z